MMNINSAVETEPETLEEKEIMSPFLAPAEKNRVQAKYKDKLFLEVFEDVKANNNDAILFVMDKYEPLMNSIYSKYQRDIAATSGDFSQSLSPEDWKNEVYLYLSGAGSSRPFYHRFSPKVENPSNENLWSTFGYYMKHYLKYYFDRLVRFQGQQISHKTTSLNQPTYFGGTEEGDSTEKLNQIMAPGTEPSPTEEKPSLTDNEALRQLFEKYLFLMKKWAEQHKKWNRMPYQVMALRSKGKSIEEIIAIVKKSRATVYKALAKAKTKWLKFLDAHKVTGKTPEELPEKKVIDAIPVER
jgi:hypothetical protein